MPSTKQPLPTPEAQDFLLVTVSGVERFQALLAPLPADTYREVAFTMAPDQWVVTHQGRTLVAAKLPKAWKPAALIQRISPREVRKLFAAALQVLVVADEA